MYRIPLRLYQRMGMLGLLTPSDRVVMLDGLLVKKMTKGPRPSIATEKSRRALEAVLPAGWHVRQEQPIILAGGPAGDSAPEPDLAVIAGDLEDYRDAHPAPED
ncbi:MAG: Uma2 family endonuclease, partial [Isosphaeraceae bacterium]|nr:Uma2 family endonuclease [Isosphaeraceae bacterium]